jgi:hypothetical protein
MVYNNVMLRPQAGQVTLSDGVTSLIAYLWTQLRVPALTRVNCVVAVPVAKTSITDGKHLSAEPLGKCLRVLQLGEAEHHEIVIATREGVRQRCGGQGYPRGPARPGCSQGRAPSPPAARHDVATDGAGGLGRFRPFVGSPA